MIVFQDLRIVSDCSNLIVEAVVPNSSYYDDVYIGSIAIDSQDTYVTNGPSSNPVYLYEAPVGVNVATANSDATCVTDRTVTYVTDDDNNVVGVKHIRLAISKGEISADLENDILFVYALASGTPSSDTPCGMDTVVTLGIALNIYPLYQKAMYYVGELADSCGTSSDFTDFILKLKAFELAIKTGNYNQAISFWSKYLSGNGATVTKKKGCGCNGAG